MLGAHGRKAGYGELAEAAMALPVPEKVTLKNPKDFQLIGRATTRLDAKDKSSGRQHYGIDTRLPGMLTAVIARPPIFGAKVASLDDSAARAIPGVKAVLRVPLDRGAEGVAELVVEVRVQVRLPVPGSLREVGLRSRPEVRQLDDGLADGLGRENRSGLVPHVDDRAFERFGLARRGAGRRRAEHAARHALRETLSAAAARNTRASRKCHTTCQRGHPRTQAESHSFKSPGGPRRRLGRLYNNPSAAGEWQNAVSGRSIRTTRSGPDRRAGGPATIR